MRLLAIGLISAGAIGYEILLMRLYSIVQWHHFAFMIISIALLGYGASGTFLVFARSWLVARFFAAWRVCAVSFGVSAYGGFALAQRLSFNPLEITWEPQQLLLLGATYVLLLVPFVFAATCIGLAFSRFGERIAGVYAADLGGAGSGAIAAVLLMIVLPAEMGVTAVLASGPLAAAAARIDKGTPLLVGVAALCIAAPQSWVAPQLSEYKGLRAALLAPGARIVAERHSPIGRITVVESRRVPFRIAPGLSLTSPHVPGEQLALFIDGEGPQPITRFAGDLDAVAHLDYTTEAAPYHARRFAHVLVLNAGTGGPVLLARYHGVPRIDAVEPNPFLADLMRGEFAAYAGHVYRPPVLLHDADIRTFVASTSDAFDLIHLPLSASRGGSIMSGINETYAYTTEALLAYLARLAPGGVVAITREAKNPPRDALKLIATAIDALAAYGVADPGRHLVLVHGWQTFTLLIKNEAFHEHELAGLKAFMTARSFDTGYYPGMQREEANRHNVLDAPYYYDGATALLGGDRRRFMASYKFDLAPATDNRPFFDNFFRWSSLREQLSLHGAAGYPLAERGYLILLATLMQAAVIALVLIVAPLALLRSQSTSEVRWRTLTYFFALGLAFLFIEMAFIQRFTLFLGEPIYAVSVVLASFLVFAGLGAAISSAAASLLSGRAAVIAAVAGIAVLAITYEALVVPRMFDVLMQGAQALKAAAVAILIAPLAFLMGVPFPVGLSHLAQRDPAQVPWAWGINGCASVLSPVVASLLAIHWGFDVVILTAVALYAAAAATST